MRNVAKIIAAAAAPAVATSLALSAAPALASSRPVAPPLIPAPGIHNGPLNQVRSFDWSGYASHGSTYKAVSAHLVQPEVTTYSGQYVSLWVGLDGFSSHSVEQTGVTAYSVFGTITMYAAWYEIYPAAPVYFSNPVAPGDHLYMAVTYNGSGRYSLRLRDVTQNWGGTIHSVLNGAANSSAEAITEAPSTITGEVLPLAHFNPVTFTGINVNGSAIGRHRPTKIVMANQSGALKAKVSPLYSGNRFAVTWLRSN